MAATRWEYRFRYLIHGLIYALGFVSPWLYWPWAADTFGFTAKTTWLVAASWLFRHGWLSFTPATLVLLALAILLTGMGAALRVWGSAYVGTAVVQSGSMHGEAMLADGPYRRTRNPLYLGTLLHTLGIALIMPPSGALMAVVLLWVFQIRLALAEEPFLARKFGEAYTAYAAAVPRFLPALGPLVPPAGARPHWAQAFLGEIYFVGAFVTLAVFGWSFNADPLRKGVLISFGVSLVARAFAPRPETTSPASETPS